MKPIENDVNPNKESCAQSVKKGFNFFGNPDIFDELFEDPLEGRFDETFLKEDADEFGKKYFGEGKYLIADSLFAVKNLEDFDNMDCMIYDEEDFKIQKIGFCDGATLILLIEKRPISSEGIYTYPYSRPTKITDKLSEVSVLEKLHSLPNKEISVYAFDKSGLLANVGKFRVDVNASAYNHAMTLSYSRHVDNRTSNNYRKDFKDLKIIPVEKFKAVDVNAIAQSED